jgi:hypothetical protein
MTTREYLNQAYRLDDRIRSKQEQIAALNDLATRCTAHMTGMPHSPNSGSSKLENAVVEPSLDSAEGGDKFQFVRVGYFCKDTKNENTYNRIVGLKDSFPKK